MRSFEFVKRMKDTSGLKLPERSTKNSAGYDFYAVEDTVIPPYHIGDNPTLVPTGVKANMMNNEFLMLVNRSSNPKKKKLVIPASMGIIDADYYDNEDNEGEMFFAFYNVSTTPVEIKKGEKLGQGIFMEYLITHNDNATGKRTGGFGSTDNAPTLQESKNDTYPLDYEHIPFIEIDDIENYKEKKSLQESANGTYPPKYTYQSESLIDEKSFKNRYKNLKDFSLTTLKVIDCMLENNDIQAIKYAIQDTSEHIKNQL